MNGWSHFFQDEDMENHDIFTREQAAALFVERLIVRCYKGVIRDVTTMLENGPPGGKPDEDLLEMHRWFQDLDEETRKHIRSVVAFTARSAVFGACAILDGVSGGYAIPGTVSSFALYLEAHRDSAADETEPPDDSVKICPTMVGEDLHVLFSHAIKERG
jgi:hypothetical protein